ncbi:hypothetical protein [Bifidobacterium sp. ESL0800]|uniref:hypothetical protein n=1 Tax=Bifidobacterium sp. ESL0800 TaxID=2983236 RepID=UPI0023F9108D|nr:hypothetical protein [Bifidobacterium sp. ESL0800]WEV75211.1 hypothetical protein OZX75_06100 [Bifidobacterium sp. ESL0800]
MASVCVAAGLFSVVPAGAASPTKSASAPVSSSVAQDKGHSAGPSSVSAANSGSSPSLRSDKAAVSGESVGTTNTKVSAPSNLAGNPRNGTAASSPEGAASTSAKGSGKVSTQGTGDTCLTVSFDGKGAMGVPASVTGRIDGAGMCLVQIPESTGMTPASSDQSFRGWSASASATTADTAYDPGSHQYNPSTLTGNTLTLYAVWRTTPAPTDVKAAYHHASDTVTVSGNADDLDDHYGTVTVCADVAADSTSCKPSGIRVSAVFPDPSDSGKLAVTATANRLSTTDLTWAGALVCPVDTPFPKFNAGNPDNAKCSNIEILTNGGSGGFGTNVDGFSIGGRYNTNDHTYTTIDSDFKNGSGSYDLWMFTRSRNWEVISTPQRVAHGYQYTAPQSLSDSGSKASAKSASRASSSAAATPFSSGAVSTRSGPIVSKAQEVRVQGAGSQPWSVTFSATDFIGWYPRDASYYLSSFLTLGGGYHTTVATSKVTRKSDVLPWVQVNLDSNSANGGPAASLSPLYGFVDGGSGSSTLTLPGAAAMPAVAGKILLGWSADPKAGSSSGNIYATGKQAIRSTDGAASPSGHGTVLTLYAIWGDPPKPYDMEIHYHRSTDTVDVTGKVDTGNDSDGVISVCMTSEGGSNACENDSGVRVDKMKVDPDDRGRIAITGTADSLTTGVQGTWVQALVCPAGSPFPNFPNYGETSNPDNPLCSNIEMLTENSNDGKLHSMGITDKRNGFRIGGHFDPGSRVEDQEWTTSDSDFKNGHGLYDIWIYRRDQHFEYKDKPIKLISKYGYPEHSEETSGTDNMYVQLHGKGVQDWKISYPRETFIAKFHIGSEHHLIVRLNVGGIASDPANLDGTLPWLKATFDANAAHNGSGTPPGELRALIDYDEKNGLITLPGQGDMQLTQLDKFDLLGWNRDSGAKGAGKDDKRPKHDVANDLWTDADAYFDQSGTATETDVTLYAIWFRRGSVLPFTGRSPRMLVLLAALLGISLMVLAVTHVLRDRFTKSR